MTRLVDILLIEQLLEAHHDFLKGWSNPQKDEVAQNNDDFWGCFLFKQIYYIFTLISSFKTWFVEGILRF